MSDLINRQDAIDIICKVSCPKVDIEQCSKEPTVCLEITALQNLPSAEPEQRWIPVTERLPEATVSVIVTSTNGYVYTSRIVSGEWEYGGNITAWMPLPEPYTERRQDE